MGILWSSPSNLKVCGDWEGGSAIPMNFDADFVFLTIVGGKDGDPNVVTLCHHSAIESKTDLQGIYAAEKKRPHLNQRPFRMWPSGSNLVKCRKPRCYGD